MNYIDGYFKLGTEKGHGIVRRVQHDFFIYEGMMIDDYWSGFGRYIWSTGQYYEGNFYKNYYYGLGKMLYPNGTIEEKFWYQYAKEI